MSLDEFGTTYDKSNVEQFGKRMLDKYGILACEEAHRLENTNLTKGSLSTYKPHVRLVVSEIGHANPSIEDSLTIIKDADKSGSTKGVMVSAIKKYYDAIDELEKAEEFHREAKRSDIVDEAFTGSMEVEEWLTVDEVNKIINVMLPEHGIRQSELGGLGSTWLITFEHRAMFETLYYTGCRVGEIPYLQVEDFDFEDNNARVYRLKKKGKEPKRDMIAIPQEFVDTLKCYLDMYEIDEGPVFDYTSRTIGTRIQDINEAYQHSYGGFDHADKLTPHKLRHARVTAIANQSGIEKAGEFVDHSSIDTTKAYRHLSVEDQRDILPEEQGESDKDKVINALVNEVSDSDGLAQAIAEKTGKTESEIAQIVESATE